jgi:hypothetical protein
MKMSELAVDADRQENGAWVDDIPEVQGLRLKVRGSNNADWRRLQAKLMDAVPRKKKLGGRIDPDEQDRILSSCLLSTCLLDWDGLEDDDGKPLPYSKTMAQKLLTEPEYRRFRDSVLWAASIVAENLTVEQEEIAGNLLTLSAGSTSGERKSKAG